LRDSWDAIFEIVSDDFEVECFVSDVLFCVTMIIWLVSLVWASLMFGGRVDGSPSLMQVRASQDLTSQIRFNVTFDEGGSPVVVYLNHSSTIHYSMSSAANVSIPAVSIILCQTSSSDPSATINSSNTWQVAQLFSSKSKVVDLFHISSDISGPLNKQV
jgi:hypothetical protein